MLRKDVAPDFYSEGMASTVRAVALCALAGQGKIGEADVRRYQPHVKEMSLFGKAHFLLSAMQIPGTEEIRKEVIDLILAHSNQAGGDFVFNEVIDDGHTRILSSPLRSNGAVLSALIAYGRTTEGAAVVGDIPAKLVRSITETRKQSGRWENTQENIFCLNALMDYGRVYESETPDMTIRVRMDQELLGETGFSDMRDAPVTLTRSFNAEDPGRKAALSIEREGTGRIYYTAGLTYSPVALKSDPVNAGIEIHREYSVERDGKWILLKDPMDISRGELVRVDLFVSLPSRAEFRCGE